MSDYYQENFPLKSVSLTRTVKSPLTQNDEQSGKLALSVAEAASDRKAGDILLLRVADVCYLADYFVMMTGYSRVQVRAIAAAVEDQVETELARRPLRTEGKADGSWVLLDYGDAIVHIMMAKEREFYNLEAFWGHAERIEFANYSDVGGKPT